MDSLGQFLTILLTRTFTPGSHFFLSSAMQMIISADIPQMTPELA